MRKKSYDLFLFLNVVFVGSFLRSLGQCMTLFICVIMLRVLSCCKEIMHQFI